MKRLFRMTYGERIGTILLLLIVAIVLYFNQRASSADHSEESFLYIDTLFQQEVKNHLSSLEFNRYERKPAIEKQTPTYELFNFDPNHIDSASLIRLGLSPFVASNITKYRRKGGLFRSSAAFGRIYGMDSLRFTQLIPYIRIDSSLFTKPAQKAKADTLPSLKFTEKQIVDLNHADTALLKKIPGIGIGYARMIVAYRQKLGGFYSTNQINEITHMPDSVKLILREWVSVASPSEIQRIPVNKSSVERLFNHPYLNFYQAKAINEIKRKRGTIRHINELSLLDEFTAAQLEQLSYYLDFDS
ncbi:MAG: helix-hairpin-helix domain-containing protein [Bacteroidales bacterium]